MHLHLIEIEPVVLSFKQPVAEIEFCLILIINILFEHVNTGEPLNLQFTTFFAHINHWISFELFVLMPVRYQWVSLVKQQDFCISYFAFVLNHFWKEY